MPQAGVATQIQKIALPPYLAAIDPNGTLTKPTVPLCIAAERGQVLRGGLYN
jgi:hypothetical protein